LICNFYWLLPFPILIGTFQVLVKNSRFIQIKIIPCFKMSQMSSEKKQLFELQKDYWAQLKQLKTLETSFQSGLNDIKDVPEDYTQKVDEYITSSTKWFNKMSKLNDDLKYTEIYSTFNTIGRFAQETMNTTLTSEINSMTEFFSRQDNRIQGLEAKIVDLETKFNEKKKAIMVDTRSDGAARTIQKFWRHRKIMKRWKFVVTSFFTSKEAKKLGERNKIINEIMSTERSYVRSLNALRVHYIDPLKREVMEDDKIPFTYNDIEKVFLNIEQIILIHHVLLQELETKIEGWPKIYLGEVFVNYSQFFSIYEQFINNYDIAIAHLKGLRQRIPKLDEFCNNQIVHSGNLNITSILIMPVQRLPRYKMLLEQLLKHTDRDHIDYKELERALAKISESVLLINEKKREHENTQISQEVKSIMGSKVFWNMNLLKRKFIMAKTMNVTKDSGKQVKNYVYFFQDLLILFVIKPENLIAKTFSFRKVDSQSKLNAKDDKPNPSTLSYDFHFLLDPTHVTMVETSPNLVIKVGEVTYTFTPEKPQDLSIIVPTIKETLANPPKFEETEKTLTKKDSIFGKKDLKPTPKTLTMKSSWINK
jgi:hypothetical protein